MPSPNKGIRAQQKALRKEICEWHLSHDETRAQTANHFGVSEYLVGKAVQEHGNGRYGEQFMPSDAIRYVHINKCVEIILAISELLDIASTYERMLWKKLEAQLVEYKDSLEYGGKVNKDFFLSLVNLPEQAQRAL